jgi:hypothetical protein
MTVPFNFATQSGNIPLSELDANFANVSASTLTATYVTGNNQSNITNVGTLNSLAVYGNVSAGNVSTNGIVRANAVVSVNYTGTNVSVTGNINTANLFVSNSFEIGNLSTAGNVTGGNLTTAGLITAVGNIIGGNVETVNLVVNRISSDDSSYVTVEDGLDIHGELLSESLEVTGNSVVNNLTVTGNFIGTDIQVNSIVNGSSNVDITNLNGNVTVGVDGVNNVLVVSSTGADVAGNISGYNLVINTIASDDSTVVTVLDDLSVQGDIDAIGSISTTGNITTGNVVTGNVLTGGEVSAAGNITSGNVFTDGVISATGNLTSGNVLTGGEVSAIGNITSGNVLTGGVISATGNITGGNLSTGGDLSTGGVISAVGNITGGNLEAVNLVINRITSDDSTAVTVLDDLSVQGGIDAFGGISTAGNVTGGNIVTSGLITGNEVSATGNITGGNLVIPNGKKITGDLSSSVAGGRTIFQTSVANGVTVLTAIPDGTGNTAGFVAYNSANSANFGFGAIVANNTGVILRAGNIGSAASPPLLIETGGAIQATVDVNGNVGIANTTPVDTLSVGGNAYVSGNITGGNVNTAGAVSATSNITGGNLVIPNGKKITGDFGNTIAGGRTVFQSFVANTSTILTAIPNGSSPTSGLIAYNSSNTANFGFGALVTSNTAVTLRAGNIGSAASLPLTIETSNVTRATFDVNGNVGIANTTPVDTLSVGGNAYVSGKVTTLPTALANLTAVAGARAFINNANLVASGNFGTLVGSGGANVVPVWSDGSNWYIG